MKLLLLPIPLLLAVFIASARIGRSHSESLLSADIRYLICAACAGAIALLCTLAIIQWEAS